MRDDYCFLCASDEGVFLDVYSDPKFLGKIKCCLTSKYSDKDSISSNVCYKCAFEVNQCSEFVNKYKLSRKTAGHKRRTGNACCLCLEPGVDGQIFDLVKERHSTNDPLQKIQDIFQSDVSKSQSLLVCVSCRYCLDVLYDLKLVYEAMNTKVKDSIVKGNKNVKIPKAKTQVISRKTTSNMRQQKGVHLMSDTDSDSSTATVRRTRKNNVGTTEKKNRQCEKCETLVENGVDMFRFHRTGLTVCKDCWIKEEPAGRSAERKRINPKNTRKCSVFLKDVFDNDARLYKVEKDEFGNTTYIITDEGSESEERPAKRLKNLDTDKREIKKWSLRGKASTLKKSQSQTEESSSEESSSLKTRIKTESLSDGESRTRRGKRKLSPDKDVLVEFASTKRKRASPILTAQPEQFKSPTTKKSEAKSTKKGTKNVTVDTKNEEQSIPTSKRGRKLKKIIESYDEDVEIKEEDDEKMNEEETKVDDHEDQSYECKQCGLEFDDKSDKVNHLLTHSKNVTLKLHRVKADKSSAETSAESENDGETVENESNPVSKDEPADVVKISKANENMDIDIEGNDSNGSEESGVVNSNSKREEEVTENVQEKSTNEPVDETINEDEKQDENSEKSIEKDETTENDKENKRLENEEKDACTNEEAADEKAADEEAADEEAVDEEASGKEAEDEKMETAVTNENDESKDKEKETSEKDKKVSTPVDETAENDETRNTKNEKDVEKKETNKTKESDSDSVDLHLSQSSAENGSSSEHVDGKASNVADDDESSCDKEAPVNGCSISKDNEDIQEANEIGKSNNASNLSSLDSVVENNKVN